MAWHLGGIVNMDAPLAGFSVIEAADLNEVIELVAKTPCARAKGPSKFGPSGDREGAVVALVHQRRAVAKLSLSRDLFHKLTSA